MAATGIVGDALTLVAGLVCGWLFVRGVRREPRKLMNGVWLVLALWLALSGGLQLWRPDFVTENGDLAIGQGSEILWLIEMLFMVASLAVGIMLVVNGVRLLKREGEGLAHLLPVVFGVIGILVPMAFVLMLLTIESAPAWLGEVYVVLSGAFLYVPVMLAAILLYTLVYAALPKPKRVDFIVVLGAGLRPDGTVIPLLARRLDKAVQVWEAGEKQAKIVVSGGRGTDERVSEATAMRQYLLEQGVPTAEIILEDKSRNTAENLRFSARLMEAQKKDYRALIVTSNYHVLRAVLLAQQQGMKAHGVGGKTAIYYLPAGFLREYIALIFEAWWLALGWMLIIAVMAWARLVF